MQETAHMISTLKETDYIVLCVKEHHHKKASSGDKPWFF